MRSTSLAAALGSIRDLQNSLARVQAQAAPLSSGRRVVVPSDDPVSAGRIVSLQGQQQRLEGYAKSAAEAKERLSSVSGALNGLQAALRSAQSAGLRGLNDASLNATQKAILAEQVDHILKQALDVADTKVQGRSVFAGFQTQASAFATTLSGALVTSVSYQGDGGVSQAQIGESVQVAMGSPGDAIFKAAGASIFDSLIVMRDALTSGNAASLAAGTAELDRAMQGLSQHQALAGARLAAIDSQDQRLNAQRSSLTALLSRHQDTDMAQAATLYQQELSVYQAGIMASAKIAQLPNLMSYL